MSKRTSISSDKSNPRKKVKISDSAKTSSTHKPILTTDWTRTDPVTGRKGRLIKKDLDYLLKHNRRREKLIQKKKKSYLKKKKEKEKELKKDDTLINLDKEVNDYNSENLSNVSIEELPFHKYTKRYKNHVCVVTGAGRGVGQAIAMRLAQEGGVVYALDKLRFRETEKLIAEDMKSEDHCVGMKCDVLDIKKMKQVLDEIYERHGYIDVLVNAISYVSAISNANKFTHELKQGEIEKSVNTNLFSMLYITKEVLPKMLSAEYGRIVSMASLEAIEGCEGYLPFTLSKAAVIGATKTIGKEYAGTGININCIAPSYVKYQKNKNLKVKTTKYSNSKNNNNNNDGSNDVDIADANGSTDDTTQRAAYLEEISGLVAFVASEENTYTTGFCYQLSTGM